MKQSKYCVSTVIFGSRTKYFVLVPENLKYPVYYLSRSNPTIHLVSSPAFISKVRNESVCVHHEPLPYKEAEKVAKLLQLLDN